MTRKFIFLPGLSLVGTVQIARIQRGATANHGGFYSVLRHWTKVLQFETLGAWGSKDHGSWIHSCISHANWHQLASSTVILDHPLSHGPNAGPCSKQASTPDHMCLAAEMKHLSTSPKRIPPKLRTHFQASYVKTYSYNRNEKHIFSNKQATK